MHNTHAKYSSFSELLTALNSKANPTNLQIHDNNIVGNFTNDPLDFCKQYIYAEAGAACWWTQSACNPRYMYIIIEYSFSTKKPSFPNGRWFAPALPGGSWGNPPC